MTLDSSEDITRLLRAWSEGDREALGELAPLVYQELHRLATRYMAQERIWHTLQTTALVNEAFEALDRLACIDPRKAKVVELRFFAGTNLEEMAEVLKVSHMTVSRDWDFAKAWLVRELSEQGKTKP